MPAWWDSWAEKRFGCWTKILRVAWAFPVENGGCFSNRIVSFHLILGWVFQEKNPWLWESWGFHVSWWWKKSHSQPPFGCNIFPCKSWAKLPTLYWCIWCFLFVLTDCTMVNHHHQITIWKGDQPLGLRIRKHWRWDDQVPNVRSLGIFLVPKNGERV